MKRIVCTVTNDLSYDQRMNRICSSLAAAGYDVTLTGRERSFSKPLGDKPFRQIRLRCFFSRGKLFYLEYNLRLLLFLLFGSWDIYCAVDLDTILPVRLIAWLKRKPFVYDAHEYFTEMEEVVARPLIKKAWKLLERATLPGVKYAYTVSEGYKTLYEKEYGVPFGVIRNVTVLREPGIKKPSAEKYILYQGSVNVGRGLEPLIGAMRQVECLLYICGLGDVYEDLKKRTAVLGLESRVIFHGYVEPEKLQSFTENAFAGITFFTNAGLSNQYSLANRFFDYLHCGVPQVAMNYPEYRSFNSRYEVALLIDDLVEDTIARALNRLLKDHACYEKLRNEALRAKKEVNWQNEEKKLLAIYEKITFPA